MYFDSLFSKASNLSNLKYTKTERLSKCGLIYFFNFSVLLPRRFSGICRRSWTYWCRAHRNVSGTVSLRSVTEQVQRNVGWPTLPTKGHAQVFFGISYFESSKYTPTIVETKFKSYLILILILITINIIKKQLPKNTIVRIGTLLKGISSDNMYYSFY